MGKKQTRRSVSLRGATFARAQAHCKKLGRSVSGYIEQVLTARMDADDVPEHLGPVQGYEKREPEPEPVDGPTLGGSWQF